MPAGAAAAQAGIGLAGGLAQSIGGMGASKRAAGAEMLGNFLAMQEQRRQFNQAQKMLEPYRTQGKGGMELYSNLVLGRQDPTAYIENDPQFKAQMRQGTQALETSAAARGGLLSGPQMKAMQKFGQETAANTYQQNLQNIWNLANMGQSSALQQANQATQLGQNIGALYQGAGQAKAGGILSVQNARNAGIGSVVQAGGQLTGGGKMGR